MKLVLSILEDPHVTSRREFMRSLLATENFQGVAGGISFGGNRVAQKEAFIFRIQDGKIEQVKCRQRLRPFPTSNEQRVTSNE